MRLFLGIDLPSEEKGKLYKQLEPLVKKYPAFDWTNPNLYHATLQFFGEVDDIPQLTEMIERSTYDKHQFFLYGLHIRMFASLHQLTLYLEYKRQKAIDDIVDTLESMYPTFVKQRKFIFHTTVAQTRTSSKQQYFHLQKKVKEIDIDISFPVRAVTLFASVKGDEGRKYITLKEFPLL